MGVSQLQSPFFFFFGPSPPPLTPLPSRELDKELHRTMNWRTGVANASVLATAARLVAARSLSFREIYEARLAFDLYDHEQDHEGIFLKDLHNISRALKLCKRALGPVQLRSELRRVTGSHTMPSRIQLHEFLQLLLSCAPLVTPTVHDVGSVEKDQRDLYRLADFRKMLTPEDQQRQQTLDAQRHWALARIKLNISSTIVRDMVNRRNRPQTRAWEVNREVDVSREVGGLGWGEDAGDATGPGCGRRRRGAPHGLVFSLSFFRPPLLAQDMVARLRQSQRTLEEARQGKALPPDVLAAVTATLNAPKSVQQRAHLTGRPARPYSAPVRRAASASSSSRSARTGRGRAGAANARGRPQTATVAGLARGERAVDSEFVRQALAELDMTEAGATEEAGDGVGWGGVEEIEKIRGEKRRRTREREDVAFLRQTRRPLSMAPSHCSP